MKEALSLLMNMTVHFDLSRAGATLLVCPPSANLQSKIINHQCTEAKPRTPSSTNAPSMRLLAIKPNQAKSNYFFPRRTWPARTPAHPVPPDHICPIKPD